MHQITRVIAGILALIIAAVVCVGLQKANNPNEPSLAQQRFVRTTSPIWALQVYVNTPNGFKTDESCHIENNTLLTRIGTSPSGADLYYVTERPAGVSERNCSNGKVFKLEPVYHSSLKPEREALREFAQATSTIATQHQLDIKFLEDLNKETGE